MPSYRYLYTDLVTGTILGELPLESASYSQVLNGPGSFRGVMPLRHPSPREYPPGFSFTDAFSRPDSATSVGLPWVTSGGTWGITGQRAYKATTDASSTMLIDTAAADHQVTADLANVADGTLNLVVRYQDPLNFILLTSITSFGTWGIFYVANGVSTYQENTGVTGFTGTFRMRAQGNTLQVWAGPTGGPLTLRRTLTIPATLLTGTSSGLSHGATAATSARTIDNVTVEEVGARTAPAEGITMATLTPARCGLYVERDGVLLWGGILWTLAADVGKNTLTLGGEGFHSYFRRRILRQTLNYTNTDQATIAKGLVDYSLGGAGAIAGLSTALVAPTGVLRTRSYFGYERKGIGEALEQLADVEGGFDFRWRPRWNAGTITTDFLISYPASGRPTPTVFTLGGNVSLENLSVDGTTMAWDAEVMGSGDGDARLIRGYVDPALTGVYPLLQEVTSENDIRSSSTLRAKAVRRVTQGRAPITIPTVVADSHTEPGLGDWEVGDQVRVVGSFGWLQVDGVYRITSYQVNVDTNGTETIPLTLAPLEAFSG